MRGRWRSRGERGAAAVEFALVMPVLFLLLFGIIDYGMYFADALSVRQATDEGARLAAIRPASASWGTASGCHSWTPFDTSGAVDTTKLESLACTVQQSSGALSGSVYVKVRVVVGSSLSGSVTDASPPIWGPDNAVRVCVIEKHSSLLGFVPVPGTITSRADMPIEDPTATTPLSGGYQPLPDGQPWPSWC